MTTKKPLWKPDVDEMSEPARKTPRRTRSTEKSTGTPSSPEKKSKKAAGEEKNDVARTLEVPIELSTEKPTDTVEEVAPLSEEERRAAELAAELAEMERITAEWQALEARGEIPTDPDEPFVPPFVPAFADRKTEEAPEPVAEVVPGTNVLETSEAVEAKNEKTSESTVRETSNVLKTDAIDTSREVEVPGLVPSPDAVAAAADEKAPVYRPSPFGMQRSPVADDLRALIAEAAKAPNSPIGNIDDIDFDHIPPFGFSLQKPDPNLPATEPAKLPDLELVDKAIRLAQEEKEFKRRVREFEAKRNPKAKQTPLAARLLGLVRDALEEAADELVGRNTEEFVLVPLNPVRVIVALSGGRDSMALLDIVARLYKQRDQALVSMVTGVYVNHGLSPNADAWEAHCRAECEKRGLRFEALRVRVNAKGDGLESAARDARYRALVRFARSSGHDIILTAHHEDDRIETFLLQWMRGAGPEGLAAFPKTRDLGRPGSFPLQSGENGNVPVILLRPWCSVVRADIERYARSQRLKWVEDESNDDLRFSRNRVRHEVIPMLESLRPGFRHAAARSVELIAETVDVLRSVAATDLERCRSEKDPRALNIFRLLELIPARQAWCLRAWFAQWGLKAPSKARLTEALRQIRETHSDDAFALRLGRKEVRRWGSDLVVRDAVNEGRSDPDRDAMLVWTGDDINLGIWGGTLKVFKCKGTEPGVSRLRLEEGLLEVRSRRGGEKLKLWANRPTKTLKALYAEADIPAFDRADLPLIRLDGEVIFAAGLGMNLNATDDPPALPLRLRARIDGVRQTRRRQFCRPLRRGAYAPRAGDEVGSCGAPQEDRGPAPSRLTRRNPSAPVARLNTAGDVVFEVESRSGNRVRFPIRGRIQSVPETRNAVRSQSLETSRERRPCVVLFECFFLTERFAAEPRPAGAPDIRSRSSASIEAVRCSRLPQRSTPASSGNSSPKVLSTPFDRRSFLGERSYG